MNALQLARWSLTAPGSVLVVDIDGTLAVDKARAHLRPSSNVHCLAGVPVSQIQRYMAPELVARDEPVAGAKRCLLALQARRVVVVTARWDALRSVTEKWMRRHYPSLRVDALLMRRMGDMRPSVDVKLELVANWIGRGDYRPGAWLDDDPQMLSAAKRLGFIGLQAPGVYNL